MKYPASHVLLLWKLSLTLADASCAFAFVWMEQQMTVNENAIVRGLFLDFPDLRTCAERLKILGIRPADLSVLLPDGSLINATAVECTRGRSVAGEGFSTDAARRQTSTSILTKALLSLGIPAYISERLECRMRNGGILLSLRCNGSVVENAETIFFESGAEDVMSTPEKRIEIVPRDGSRKQRYTPKPIPVWHERASA